MKLVVNSNTKPKKTLTKDDVIPTLNYIQGYWSTLRRETTTSDSTLIALPNPYVVPGGGDGQFIFEEQYYWDSYFIALGIDDEALVTGMLDNLIFLFNKFEMIPNGNRFYLTSRSQPPILTTFIFHIYDKYNKPTDWLREHIDIAKREYNNVWINDQHPNHHNVYKGLSRYYDINHLHDLAEAESGWDMTPRFKRQCLDYLPIDLNCLLYKYEMDFARAASILQTGEEEFWTTLAKDRKQSVDALLWDSRQGFYFDYNFRDKEKGKVWSLAAYYSLWTGLADEKQAEKLVKRLGRFEKKGGLTTTIGNYMYFSLFGSTNAQWAYPNGWAPLHYIVCEGLENYGYSDKSSKIAKLWLQNCNNWFIKTGELQEKYNVVNPELKPADGLYPSQTGFGWTNAVFSYMANKYLV